MLRTDDFLPISEPANHDKGFQTSTTQTIDLSRFSNILSHFRKPHYTPTLEWLFNWRIVPCFPHEKSYFANRKLLKSLSYIDPL